MAIFNSYVSHYQRVIGNTIFRLRGLPVSSHLFVVAKKNRIPRLLDVGGPPWDFFGVD